MESHCPQETGAEMESARATCPDCSGTVWVRKPLVEGKQLRCLAPEGCGAYLKVVWRMGFGQGGDFSLQRYAPF